MPSGHWVFASVSAPVLSQVPSPYETSISPSRMRFSRVESSPTLHWRCVTLRRPFSSLVHFSKDPKWHCVFPFVVSSSLINAIVFPRSVVRSLSEVTEGLTLYNVSPSHVLCGKSRHQHIFLIYGLWHVDHVLDLEGTSFGH